MTLRTAQNIFLPKNINAVTNCIENSTVSRGIWEDVTNSRNGEPGTGNGSLGTSVQRQPS